MLELWIDEFAFDDDFQTSWYSLNSGSILGSDIALSAIPGRQKGKLRDANLVDIFNELPTGSTF